MRGHSRRSVEATARCLLCLAVTSAAARASDTPIRFETISIEEGLSQSTVYAICQDPQGFMWFGTEDGLNRYDGYEFEVFVNDPEDETSLAANTVYSLLVDRTGDLWVGTWSGGLDRYDPASRSFIHHRHDPEDPSTIPGRVVRSVLEDRAGALWVGTEDGGLAQMVDGRVLRRFVHDADDPSSLGAGGIWAIHEDATNRIWVGTSRGGLSRLDRDTGRFTRYESDPRDPASLGSNSVFAIAEDLEGNLWVGSTGGGIQRLDREGRRFWTMPLGASAKGFDEVQALHLDPGGLLWFGTDGGGLGRFDPRDPRVDRFAGAPAGRQVADVASIFSDRGGLLWLGTEGRGIQKHAPAASKFTHYGHDPDDPRTLRDDMVMAIQEDRAGRLWVGTYGAGAHRYDPETESWVNYSTASGRLATDAAYAFHEDRNGVLWVGTRGAGLRRYVPARDRFEPLNAVLGGGLDVTAEDVLALEEDSSGSLWFSTISNGLGRLSADRRRVTAYRHDPQDPTSLPSDRPRHIMTDSAGRVWIAAELGGVSRYVPEDDTFVRYLHDPGDPTSLSSDDTQFIHESTDGTFWVATYGGGLNRFDPDSGRFEALTVKHGLPNNAVYAVLEDDQGQLWLSTNHGLSHFDPKRKTFRNYDVDDGLQSNEFNAGAAFRALDGILYFGGIGGFNAFDPAKLQHNVHPPPLVFTAISKLNETIAQGTALADLEELTVLHDEGVISFQFAGLDFTRPHKNQYAYRMEGFDRDWIEAGTKRDATYTNLDPGRYTFRVKGSNNDGVWNETGVSVDVVVLPPWWRTWWARFGGFAGLALLLIAGHRARTARIHHRNEELRLMNTELNRQVRERERAELERAQTVQELEAKNAELERYSHSVSHDLKSPLVTIRGFIGHLSSDISSGSLDRAADDIARIGSAADRMNLLLEEFAELSRVGRVVNDPEAMSMTELAREASELVAGQLETSGASLIIPDDLPVVIGDRRRLREVLQNLMSNAIKYMGDQSEPRVEVGFRTTPAGNIHYVRDNGLGIAAEHRDRVFGLFERLNRQVEGTGVGLALVKKIIEAHGGRIWVESDGPGLGSSFCFTLPAMDVLPETTS